MSSVPKFSNRTAIQVDRLLSTLGESWRAAKYMPVIGWEVGFDKDFVAGPVLGLHEADLIPKHLQVECYGLRIAYNIPDRVMKTLHSSVLDFDGKRFLFVQDEEN